MLAEPVSRPWRSYLRFSVRGLIVLVLVIGGWLGWIVRSARIQREAVAAIKSARGVVGYDWEWSNGKSIPVHHNRVTDVGVAGLIGLTKLAFLDLSNTQVTDVGLAHLSGLTTLSDLDLSHTEVTDAGVRELQRALPSLNIHRY